VLVTGGAGFVASTGGALIGAAAPPVDERSLPKPLSPYGASKLAGEGYAHAAVAVVQVRGFPRLAAFTN
jgi:nucleoside-diphosphate-sugar epimerase